MMKKRPQSPFSQSTIAPEDEAKRVRPAVPMDARSAYCVAVYDRSTNIDINATKVTVANAPVKSSITTAKAKSASDLPDQASNENNRFVAAIRKPARNMARTNPARTANNPPNIVKATVVTQPNPFE